MEKLLGAASPAFVPQIISFEKHQKEERVLSKTKLIILEGILQGCIRKTQSSCLNYYLLIIV